MNWRFLRGGVFGYVMSFSDLFPAFSDNGTLAPTSEDLAFSPLLSNPDTLLSSSFLLAHSEKYAQLPKRGLAFSISTNYIKNWKC